MAARLIVSFGIVLFIAMMSGLLWQFNESDSTFSIFYCVCAQTLFLMIGGGILFGVWMR